MSIGPQLTGKPYIDRQVSRQMRRDQQDPYMAPLNSGLASLSQIESHIGSIDAKTPIASSIAVQAANLRSERRKLSVEAAYPVQREIHDRRMMSEVLALQREWYQAQKTVHAQYTKHGSKSEAQREQEERHDRKHEMEEAWEKTEHFFLHEFTENFIRKFHGQLPFWDRIIAKPFEFVYKKFQHQVEHLNKENAEIDQALERIKQSNLNQESQRKLTERLVAMMQTNNQRLAKAERVRGYSRDVYSMVGERTLNPSGTPLNIELTSEEAKELSKLQGELFQKKLNDLLRFSGGRRGGAGGGGGMSIKSGTGAGSASISDIKELLGHAAHGGQRDWVVHPVENLLLKWWDKTIGSPIEEKKSKLGEKAKEWFDRKVEEYFPGTMKDDHHKTHDLFEGVQEHTAATADSTAEVSEGVQDLTNLLEVKLDKMIEAMHRLEECMCVKGGRRRSKSARDLEETRMAARRDVSETEIAASAAVANRVLDEMHTSTASTEAKPVDHEVVKQDEIHRIEAHETPAGQKLMQDEAEAIGKAVVHEQALEAKKHFHNAGLAAEILEGMGHGSHGEGPHATPGSPPHEPTLLDDILTYGKEVVGGAVVGGLAKFSKYGRSLLSRAPGLFKSGLGRAAGTAAAVGGLVGEVGERVGGVRGVTSAAGTLMGRIGSFAGDVGSTVAGAAGRGIWGGTKYVAGVTGRAIGRSITTERPPGVFGLPGLTKLGALGAVAMPAIETYGDLKDMYTGRKSVSEGVHHIVPNAFEAAGAVAGSRFGIGGEMLGRYLGRKVGDASVWTGDNLGNGLDLLYHGATGGISGFAKRRQELQAKYADQRKAEEEARTHIPTPEEARANASKALPSDLEERYRSGKWNRMMVDIMSAGPLFPLLGIAREQLGVEKGIHDAMTEQERQDNIKKYGTATPTVGDKNLRNGSIATADLLGSTRHTVGGVQMQSVGRGGADAAPEQSSLTRTDQDTTIHASGGAGASYVGGNLGKNTPMPSMAVGKDIVDAANAVGVNPAYMLAVAGHESGFQPGITNSIGATGLNQFIPSTWKTMLAKYGSKYGYDSNTSATDPLANARMGAEFTNENRKSLQQALPGRQIGDTELYSAAFLGAGGASKFLSALDNNPNASAIDALGDYGKQVAKYNPSIMYGKDGKARTLQQVYDTLNATVTQQEGKYASLLSNPDSSNMMADASTPPKVPDLGGGGNLADKYRMDKENQYNETPQPPVQKPPPAAAPAGPVNPTPMTDVSLYIDDLGLMSINTSVI